MINGQPIAYPYYRLWGKIILFLKGGKLILLKSFTALSISASNWLRKIVEIYYRQSI